jgi:ribokinase
VPVLLNPAPAPGCELDELCRHLEYLTPNRVEAAQLLGADPAQDPETMARALSEAAGGTVFLTLGAEGVCVCRGRECAVVAAPPVQAVDSVGAGDCFAGTLAVALAEGRPMREAARFAACGAALSVRKEGAQPSMPRREEIDRLIAQLNGKREL